MKKLVATSILVGLLAGALVAPVEAAKRKPKSRSAQGSYDNPALGIPGVAGSGAAGGFYEFAVMPKERKVAIKIVDDGGQAVTATLSQNTNPDTPQWEIFATICGKTSKPLAIAPNLAVRVSVYTTPGRDQFTCTGVASSGTIKATFSR
jgi:hypothetical protein